MSNYPDGFTQSDHDRIFDAQETGPREYVVTVNIYVTAPDKEDAAEDYARLREAILQNNYDVDEVNEA